MSAAFLLLSISSPIQIAILFDTNLAVPESGRPRRFDTGPRDLPDRVRAELTAFDQTLRAEGALPEYAVVTCDVATKELGHRKFDLTVQNLAAWLDMMAAGQPCTPGADAIDFAVESFDWADGEKRILILSEFDRFEMYVRTTAEEAVHRAERAGIVVHALEFLYDDRWFPVRGAELLTNEMHRFLDRPTEALGRPPSHTRHATLLSGGAYFVGPAKSQLRGQPLRFRAHRERDGAKQLDFQLRRDADPKKTYAKGAAGTDGLDDLADGRRQPSEVSQSELPAQLQGLDLEPLLDAIWNYVDARRTIDSLQRETTKLLARPVEKGGALGTALAKAMLRPRRLPPSRR